MHITKIHRLLVAATLILISSYALQAQKKDFTQEQLLKNKMPDIISPLPFVTWDSDNQLIISKRAHKDSALQKFLFDFKTRKEMAYTSPAKSSAQRKSVFSKGNDLFYRLNGEAEVQLTNDASKELNPTFSPDSNYIAYTKENNLYILDLNSKNEMQITKDGSETILNGYASWVYMEEILGRATRYKAFWWSPDSKHVAFFRSDESEVPVFILTNAAGMHGEVEKTRYPQPGDKNPEVKIGIATVSGSPVTWADFNEKDDQYFGMPYFKNDGSLLVQWLNRDQNDLKIYDVDLNTGKKKIFYEEQQKTWIDLDDNDRLSFLKSGNVLMLSDKTGWRHIYYLDANGKEINAVTSGKFTVKDITFVDEKNMAIYFTARGLENTAAMDFYKVGFNGKNLKRLTFGSFNNRVQMSPDGKYFINTYSNAYTPPRMALMKNDGVIIANIGDSKGTEFDNYNIAQTELIRVKSDDGLYDLPAMVTWPANMDPNKKYPVLISIYGGPNAGTVWNSFSFSG
jgi:dipeptidyl-peptidase-4